MRRHEYARDGWIHGRAPWWSMATALLAIMALAGCAPRAASPKPVATPVPPDARLAGQLVYVTVGLSQGLSTPGLVEALNAQTGALVWKAQTYATAGAPAVANGALYVGADDGSVRAFDASTGQPRWTFTRTVGVGPRFGLDGYAAVSGDSVLVTSDGGAVYALDAATGKQRWVFALTTAVTHIYTTPAVGSGVAYIASAGPNSSLYALDIATGKTRWTATQAGGFDGPPTLVGDTLYVGANLADTVNAYNAATGASLWSYDTGSPVHSALAIGADAVYVGSQDAIVAAISASGHTRSWKFQTEGNAPQPLIGTGAAPTLDGQTVYVGSQGGIVYALDTATGKPRWQVSLDSPIDGAPAVMDDTLFAATEAGDVVALRASDGATLWRTKAGGFIIAAPVVAAPGGTGA